VIFFTKAINAKFVPIDHAMEKNNKMGTIEKKQAPVLAV
jgi:hypothetical protein